ncbi:MAG: 4a-hydroxytetrahydrobiopterin dehydratase [Verrucomicrobia bacterium]|nr:4a-hydroxytetrahydrobiopterin dehydratase [Verrucomicrobiota bacterium]
MPKLNSTQIKAGLERLPEWRRRRQVIGRTYQFKDFRAAMRFVNAVAKCAEEAGHHPDISIRWNRVTLELTTHDAGGLSEKDFNLARGLDRLIK